MDADYSLTPEQIGVHLSAGNYPSPSECGRTPVLPARAETELGVQGEARNAPCSQNNVLQSD